MAKNNQNAAPEQVENKVVSAENKALPAKKKGKKFVKFIISVFVVLVVACAVMWQQLQQQKKAAVNNETVESLKTACETKMNDLNNRLETLEKNIAELQGKSSGAKASDVARAEVQKQISDMDRKFAAQIAELQANVPEKVVLSAADKEIRIKQELLLAAGVMTIRDLAERGLPFSYETEVLKIIAQGNEPAMRYIEGMQRYAVSGIKGKQTLIKEFNLFYDSLSKKENIEANAEKTADEKQKRESYWEELLTAVGQWFKGLFVSTKTSGIPVLVKDEDKVHMLVNDGDLAAALNELDTSSVYAQLKSDVLQQWKMQARVYLEFERSVSGLLMNSLANLHLKEMEH